MTRSTIDEHRDTVQGHPPGCGSPRQAPETPGSADDRDWVAELRGPPAVRDAARADLHALLLQGARFGLARRRRLLAGVPQRELERIAVEAAGEATVAVLAQLDSFRGASRFKTWAYRFVLFQAGVAAQRLAWHGRDAGVAIDVLTPRAIRALVQASLTPHERDVFAALALNDVPIDVLAERLNTTRGELYETLRDARGKLRATMVEVGLCRAD